MTDTPTTAPPAVRVLAVTRRPESDSFQQRVVQFLTPLAEQGVQVETAVLPSGWLQQRRFIDRFTDFDVVWWHRHLLTPWLLGRLRQRARRLVFDFDDPLPYSARHGGQRSVTRRLRFASMLRCCDVALPASNFLAELARPYCERLQLQPMAIDCPAEEAAPPLERRPGPTTMLWLGGKNGSTQVAMLTSVLRQLGQRYRELTLRVIGMDPSDWAPLRVDCRADTPAEQAAALRECHIGLGPMPETVWTRARTSPWVLKYMAYGMAWVGSAVDENVVAGGEGTRGYCAADPDGWLTALCQLVDDAPRRQRMGAAGRAHILNQHCKPVLTGRLTQLFRSLASPPPTAGT